MGKRILQTAVLTILVLMLSSAAASGATFYVRLDGSNSNTGLTNDSVGAWRTIDYAADQLAAGDTVRVQAGTYGESVTPTIGGTVSAPITFVADGAVTFCTLVLSDGDDYLRFIGFTIDTDAGSCVKAPRAVLIANGSTTRGVEFWNNTIRDATQGGITTGGSTTRMHNWVVIGNVIENIGGPSTGVAVSVSGDNNLFAYNELRSIRPDVFAITNNRYGYWLNNYIHNISEAFGGHPDVFQAGSGTLGLSYNVFEATFQDGVGAVAPNEHAAQMSHNQSGNCVGSCGAMTENIWRRNVFHNLGSGTIGINQTTSGPITFTRAYHNSAVKVVRADPTGRRAFAWMNTSDNYLLNDLFYEGWGITPSSNPDVFLIENTYTANYNLAYDADGAVTFAAGWTNQANEQSNVNPQFVNVDAGNFTLGASSGAIGAAGPLTTTSGSGTGTTFNVAAGGGGFFRGPNSNIAQYGGKLTEGDVITIGTDTRTVASVSGDRITVTSPLTWADGEPVYYGTDTSPDIGAYPYKAGGYTLSASYAMGGSTATITPNDASLVRFVVCYSDRVPYALDNSSPYTCAAPAGQFSANVYPRYASRTLWVTVGGGPSVPTTPTAPSAPKNLKIVP